MGDRGCMFKNSKVYFDTYHMFISMALNLKNIPGLYKKWSYDMISKKVIVTFI